MGDLFESAADFLADDMTIEYLIDDIIEKNTTGVMFGESGAGKSFIAVDIGLSVAFGVEIFNTKLAEKGLVFYVAGEGYGGLKRRIKAWQLSKEIDAKEMKLFYLSKKSIKFDGEGVDRVIGEGLELQTENKTPVALIIVDTLARHMEGDENSTNDMGKFVRAIGLVQSTFPDSVMLVVHHTGHNDKNRLRGSSSLKAAMDFEILIKKKGKDKGKIEFTKMKDSEPPNEMEFTLIPVAIGFDRKEKQITSCIVEYKELVKIEPQKYPTGLEVTGLEALINVCVVEPKISEGKYYATLERWKSEFQRLRLLCEQDKSPKAIDMSFNRADGNGVKDKLVNKGIVSITEIGVFPVRETDQAKIADEINRLNSSGT